MKIWEWKTIRNDQEIYYYNASRNFIPEEFAGQLFEMIQETVWGLSSDIN